MSKYKSLLYVFLITTIAFTVFHFTLLFTCTQTLHTQSLSIILISYGFSILMAALAWNEGCKDRNVWHKAGVVMAALFAVSFLAMALHVTIAFMVRSYDYMNIYFNVPLWYAVPMYIFAILWALTKRNPIIEMNPRERTVVGKIIDAVPVVLLIVMGVHVLIVTVKDVIRQITDPLATSFPWWAMPLLIALAYIAAIGVALLIRGIYNYVQRHRKE